MSIDDLLPDIERHWSKLTDAWHDRNDDGAEPEPADLPTDFVSRSAEDKCAFLAEQLARRYARLPIHPQGNGVKLVEKAYLWQTFDAASDSLPDVPDETPASRRVKIVHCFGVGGVFHFTPAPDSPFTGMLAHTQDVIGRLANAANTRDPTWSFNQSVAMKFLLDGKPSLSLLGLAKPEGQGRDTNFFRRSAATYTGCPESLSLKLAYVAFMRALDDKRFNKGCPQSAIQLTLRPLCSVNPDGSAVSDDDVNAPLGLHMQARAELAQWWDAAAAKRPDGDWRDVFAGLTVGDVLFDLVATTPPQRAPGQVVDENAPRAVGTLTLKSPLVASAFCDRRLFFQHPRRTENVGTFPRC